MRTNMEQLKIAYFNQLGRKELDQAKIKFEQIYPNIK
ncbi:transcriptional regulator, partial [Lactobacillus acidophilus]|nr:transcriptional regulator [Lactobacillus acidophilus]